MQRGEAFPDTFGSESAPLRRGDVLNVESANRYNAEGENVQAYVGLKSCTPMAFPAVQNVLRASLTVPGRLQWRQGV